MNVNNETKEKTKNPYHSPQLTTYGDITELTRAARGGQHTPDGQYLGGTVYSDR